MSPYIKDTTERVVRTVAQAFFGAVSLYLTGAVGEAGWDGINWSVCWKAGAAAGILSLATALAAKSFASPDDASFTE